MQFQPNGSRPAHAFLLLAFPKTLDRRGRTAIPLAMRRLGATDRGILPRFRTISWPFYAESANDTLDSGRFLRSQLAAGFWGVHEN
jgi:hypothetical protein